MVRATAVPGSSTGYWATPHPRTTVATPSAAMAWTPVSRPAVSRAEAASPHVGQDRQRQRPAGEAGIQRRVRAIQAARAGCAAAIFTRRLCR